jgi:hypothetical protein
MRNRTIDAEHRPIYLERNGNSVKRQCDRCVMHGSKDLGPARGHEVMIPIGLLRGLRLPPYMPVLDLESRFRCRECDASGKVVVSIKWVDQ